ncbi:hypothetical protein Ddc_18634 [Ditylenchus destructor]|nr:hypothetical protein Ddc_18634 [Ditylenchus destructor]
MDNGTMVEVFKYLNYCGLAKNSLVSKRFRNLIQTHRHSFALFDVYSLEMRRRRRLRGSDPAGIKMFGKDISSDEYNEWVTRNQYSKQISLKGQDAATENTQFDRIVYALDVVPNYCGSYDETSIFYARVKLNHENWPLFQHFVRLLTDPFIYIRNVELTSQNDVFNLLQEISPDHSRLQCGEFRFNLEANSQKFISWIKDHVCCDKFEISNHSDSNYDDELLDLFLTGANCASKISVYYYDHSRVIVGFTQKFMDLKKCDECQVVEYIECSQANVSVAELKSKYAEFIVKEEKSHYIFELVNKNIGKKLKITVNVVYDHIHFLVD